MCGCSYRSWEPTTQTFHLRGRLPISGLPRPMFTVKSLMDLTRARVSKISCGSIPASGLPTGLRTLSSPDWIVERPTACRPSRISGTSGSWTPRNWKFWRVVMSAQPSSPYLAMVLPRKRTCSEVTMPFGIFVRIMKRPSAAEVGVGPVAGVRVV